jgi:hypothetical protein
MGAMTRRRRWAPALAVIVPALLVPVFQGCGGTASAAAPAGAANAPAPAPAAARPAPPPGGQTADTIRDEGLFGVLRVDRKLLFEIPDSLLGRDILLISQIAGSPENFSGFLNAGTNVAEQVIRWERREGRFLLRGITFANVADPELPIARSVEANTFWPIIRSFTPESGARPGTTLVDVTPLFETDVEAIAAIQGGQRQQYGVRRLDPSRTFLDSARSFPRNVEVRHTLTYEAGSPPTQSRTATISVQMAQSFVLLPDEPMRPRFHDPRVGWFTVAQIDFGSEAYKADQRRLIRRWRLEPSDPAAYARGELVEPVEPIVFYLDPGTPDAWAPYIRQGVEDWKPAFESAGFRNAIVVRDIPSPAEDPDFSPEDVRYNMVRYTANLTRNAVGPSVSDPRTGEIIASDIIWYHNHLRSYRNRLMIETGAANPAARSLMMDRDYIGEAVRQVIAHEIGHALGLPHNMIASSAFPVDSLRSPSFTAEFGVAATIMDYARQNYVAQPGDGVERFIRGIGPYDHYAIEWGYRLFPGTTSPDDERAVLDTFVRAHADDRRFRFGAGNFDPDNQTEDLGDDPVRASGYGIANLRRVLPNLPEWTRTGTPGEDHAELSELYGELVSSWSRYVGHVVTLVGGVHTTLRAADQEGPVHVPVAVERQRAAVAFLAREVFATPTWLNEPAVLTRIEATGAVNRIRGLQASRLNQLLDPARMLRMQEAELAGHPAYPLPEYLADVRGAVWGELASAASIDPYRRNLQRAHVERLGTLVDPEAGGTGDVPALARAELRTLLGSVRTAAGRAGLDPVTRAHLEDVEARIAALVEG